MHDERTCTTIAGADPLDVLAILTRGRRTRQVWYVAHPLRPTDSEVNEVPCTPVVRSIGEYESDLELSDAERVRTATRHNLDRAMRWLSWLRRRYPSVTFIAPWIASVMSGDDDADPAQREAGMLDAVAVASRCDGLVLCGGRVSTGMARERDAATLIVDLTSLGEEPPR